MRLSEAKVESLSKKICDEIAKSQVCVMERAPGPVMEAIKHTLLSDLKLEEAIEAEAEKILEEHMDEIRFRGADYHTLFKKTKSLLAKKKKFVY